MEGHIHLSFMWALDILAVMLIGHFIMRTWAGLRSDSPAMKGLSYVA